MGHHAKASGYDRLVHEFSHRANLITPNLPLQTRYKVLSRLMQRFIRRANCDWYNRVSLSVELKAAVRWLSSREQIFHYLYGENTYSNLGLLKARWANRHAIIATYHTPIWRFNEVVRNQQPLGMLDGVIVMSNNQQEFFSEIIGEGRVFFVPHGVDTQYFSPPEHWHFERKKFVTVGHHLRDFSVLEQVANAVGKACPDVEFVVVARPDKLESLTKLPNVICESGISDERLLEHYRTATALLLPLEDATANNALLEGMACGLPILSTDIQGVRDYTSTKNTILHKPGKANNLVDAIIALSKDELDVTDMRQASRDLALGLDWQNIAAKTQEVYQRFT